MHFVYVLFWFTSRQGPRHLLPVALHTAILPHHNDQSSRGHIVDAIKQGYSTWGIPFAYDPYVSVTLVDAVWHIHVEMLIFVKT